MAITETHVATLHRCVTTFRECSTLLRPGKPPYLLQPLKIGFLLDATLQNGANKNK